MTWWQRLLDTPRDYASLIVRLGLGLVMFPHGAQKVLGWFGGHGFSASMAMFTQMMHIPAFFGFCAIAAEFLGSICLILGLVGRLAALAIGIDMLVAVVMVHAHNGFFMNWTGQQAGEGFEYHILTWAMALAILVQGSGAYSLDRLILRNGNRNMRLGSPTFVPGETGVTDESALR